MKPLLALLVLASLALNATLAYSLLTTPVAPAAAPVASVAKVTAAPGPKIDDQTWSELSTGDTANLATTLRTQGFPPDIVRAIIAAQIHESYAARRKALSSNQSSTPYWQTTQPDVTSLAALRQLSKEEENELRAVLGRDPSDPLSRLNNNRDLSYLPAQKASELQRIMDQFDEQRSDLYTSGSSVLNRDKITALEKAQLAAIAAALTPQELLEYNLRNSNTASALRDSLSAFKPTEAEFRAIYPLQAQFDERYSGDFFIGATPDQQRDRTTAQKQLADQIKATLGPERAADYERTTDYNYMQTAKLIDRLELPPATADQLVAIQKEFNQRRMDVMRTNNSNRDQIVQQVTALQQEAIARVTPLLGGASHVEAYKSYGGSWLTNYVPTFNAQPIIRR